jgi:hypothetical protein
MTGVLQIEAMAQLGGIAMLDPSDEAARNQFFFGGIEGCRFRRPVVPGDTLVGCAGGRGQETAAARPRAACRLRIQWRDGAARPFVYATERQPFYRGVCWQAPRAARSTRSAVQRGPARGFLASAPPMHRPCPIQL